MSGMQVAVWGMSSLVVAFIAVCLCLVAAIWQAEIAARVFATIVAISLFSLFRGPVRPRRYR